MARKESLQPACLFSLAEKGNTWNENCATTSVEKFYSPKNFAHFISKNGVNYWQLLRCLKDENHVPKLLI